MKTMLKVLCAAWLTGAVMGGGCFCGAVAAGVLMPKKGPSDDFLFVQAQIVEIQQAIESLSVPMPEGFDEMAGLEP